MEKYWPFLSTLSLYVWPFSWFFISMMAPVMGLPSRSSTVPFTVAVCDQAGTATSRLNSAAITMSAQRFVILSSRRAGWRPMKIVVGLWSLVVGLDQSAKSNVFYSCSVLSRAGRYLGVRNRVAGA